MSPIARLAIAATITFSCFTPLTAADSDRDFSGKWLLNQDHSNLRALSTESYPVLLIEQKTAIHCVATTAGGASAEWTFTLDGEDSKYRIGAESMNSAAKWEGAALLINTLVSGPQNYTVMDRWTLSRDGAQLNIERQVFQGPNQTEGYLVYRREGSGPPPGETVAIQPFPERGTQPALIRRPEPAPAAPPARYLVPAGTHILLTLSNSVSTKSSKDGDRIYLQTAIPIALDGRVIIPRGSYVQGTVTKTKAAGRLNSKGQLYIRFDTLTLPNGVTRDFRARLTSADASKGKVDPEEGKITGDKGPDGRKAGRDIGIGTMGGVIVGGAAGHPVAGLGAGAAAGLAAVLLSKNQEVVLPRGTSVEMVLDRDIYYTADELRH